MSESLPLKERNAAMTPDTHLCTCPRNCATVCFALAPVTTRGVGAIGCSASGTSREVRPGLVLGTEEKGFSPSKEHRPRSHARNSATIDKFETSISQGTGRRETREKIIEEKSFRRGSILQRMSIRRARIHQLMRWHRGTGAVQ